MTQAELLEQAKQGDADAIATLINQTLQPKGIAATVERQGTDLEVMLEAKGPIDRVAAVKFMRAGLMGLGLQGIDTVQLGAQRLGATFPDWMEGIALTSAPDSPGETVNGRTPHQNKLPLKGKKDTLERQTTPPPSVQTTQGMPQSATSLQDIRHAEILQTFQAVLGDTFKVRVNGTKRQLAILIDCPETSRLQTADAIAILESLDLAAPDSLANQQIGKLKVLQSLRGKSPGQPEIVVEISATSARSLPARSLPAHQTRDLQPAPGGNQVFHRVLALSMSVVVVCAGILWFESKQQAAIQVLDDTNYCPDSVQVNNNPPPAEDSQTIQGDVTSYYLPVAITGPVFRAGGASTSCVHFNLYISSAFDPKQKQIIIRAAQIMAQRVMQYQTFECTYKNATRDYLAASAEADEEKLRGAFWESLVYVDDSASIGIEGVELPKGGALYIDGFSADFSPAHGLALLDLYYEAQELRINLNADYIGRRLDYLGYVLPNGPELWAGVIAHEIMHNLGWIHPNGYEETVILEFGKCVSADGEDLPRLPIALQLVSALITITVLVGGILLGRYFWLKYSFKAAR